MGASKLETLRRQKNFTQQELADLLSTDVSNYSRKERGLVKIYEDEWEKLAAALEVSVKDLKGNERPDKIFIPENGGSSYQYELVIKKMEKYILLLEKQNQELREEIKCLLKKDIDEI